MNSRSVLCVSFNVRALITIHCHAFHLFVMIAVYLLFLPPYSSVDPAATTDYTAAAHDYVVDDSTTTVELLGKQSHFPSPTYHLIVYILSVALGIDVATFLIYSNA